MKNVAWEFLGRVLATVLAMVFLFLAVWYFGFERPRVQNQIEALEDLNVLLRTEHLIRTGWGPDRDTVAQRELIEWRDSLKIAAE